MDNKGLPARLWILSKEVKEKANDSMRSGELVKTEELYLKPKVDHFDYKEGGISYQMSRDFITKEVWDWKKLSDFFHKVIERIPDYHQIASGISKKYEVSETQANFWLERFTYALIHKIPEGLTEEALVDAVSTFVNDLEKVPIEWKLKVWIDGLWLEDEEYDICEGLRIRRPKPSDIEIERPFYSALTPMLRPSFRETSSAILELTYRAKERGNYQNEVENIINCLRLFRLGSVFSVKIESQPKSILEMGATMGSLQITSPTYKYSLSEKDIPKLKELIGKIKNLLPLEPLSPPTERRDPVYIALQRFNDALLKAESVESRITSAITCFEALYLKAEERMELSHRLSQRAAALLRLFGITPLEVYNNLIRAYDIRSTFIHGSFIDPEKHRDTAQLAEKILSYARISLLAFFQLKNLTDKDSFISRIDNSLLDMNAYSKLKEFVEEHCPIQAAFR